MSSAWALSLYAENNALQSMRSFSYTSETRYYQDAFILPSPTTRRAPKSTKKSNTATNQQVKTKTHGHLNTHSEGTWSDLISQLKKRTKDHCFNRSEIKILIIWLWNHKGILILVHWGLVSWDWLAYHRAHPWGKLIPPLKHRLITCSSPFPKEASWEFPHPQWQVNWYSHSLLWLRKPYCCDFLPYISVTYRRYCLTASILALSYDSYQSFHPSSMMCSKP